MQILPPSPVVALVTPHLRLRELEAGERAALPDAPPAPSRLLGITHSASGRLIGRCWMLRRSGWPDCLSAQIGFALAPACRGNGYAAEVVRVLLAHAFRSLGLRRIWARAPAQDGATCRALQQSGMRLEAQLRPRSGAAGRSPAVRVYAIHAEGFGRELPRE